MWNDLRQLFLEFGVGQRNVFDGLYGRVVIFVIVVTRSGLGHANPFEAGDIIAACDGKIRALSGKCQ